MKFIFSFLVIALIISYSFAQDTTGRKNNSPIDTIHTGKVFTYAEIMPVFPGGDAGYVEFLQSNLKYPMEARQKGIEGIVTLKFIVNEDGSFSDIKVVRGLGGGCTEEALRLMKIMPKWIPAQTNNTNVRVYFNLPIKFSLLQEDGY